MKYRKLTSVAILFSLVIGWGLSQAQEQVAFEIEPSSQMTISGTSSLHDWESTVNEISGTASVIIQQAEITDIRDLMVSIPIKGIKSGKSIMDGKTYKALLEEQYPAILFKGMGVEKSGVNKLKINGELSIAGVKRDIQIPVEYQLKGEKLTVSGSINLKMTDFNIDPPTALMGTLKTGDEIKISFKTESKKEIL